MTLNFILTEALFCAVGLLGLKVMSEFIQTRNGILRKILICYFAVESFTYLSAALFFLVTNYKWSDMTIETYRLIVITPKAIVKIWLIWYLKTTRKKKAT